MHHHWLGAWVWMDGSCIHGKDAAMDVFGVHTHNQVIVSECVRHGVWRGCGGLWPVYGMVWC